ncbi:hypothetical protein [Thiohalorhabdus methylotrophus]|uniref:Uncharacterized protein n=1 Tax=Thiohalorhabdus methylotrophus TaxID=3242694 RepID=A0ABV4TTW3_9GAMM
MERNKALAATISLLAATGLTACGGGGGGGGGNGDDSATSFQKQFSESDSYDVIENPSSFNLKSTTLAVTNPDGSNIDGSLAAGMDDTDYYGAVDPDAINDPDNDADATNNAWWQGWTYRNGSVDGNFPGSSNFHPLEDEIKNSMSPDTNDGSCPKGTHKGTTSAFGDSYDVCALADGDITGSTATLNNEHIWLLTETVNIGDGGDQNNSAGTGDVVLTIEPGTMVMGASSGTVDDVALVITRGSQIKVQGTKEQPVIMGAVDFDGTTITGDVTDLTDRGEWGGLVVDGLATVNSAATPGNAPGNGGSVASEAVPDGKDRYFGGGTDNDNSGEIRYLIIAESGYAFREDQEVQGLTLEGVGSGTTATDGGPFVDYLQVLGSEDDGVEWFGGTAGMNHVVINGQDDDGLDQDLGWQGKVQYALILMGADNGNRAMETDGNGDDFDAKPYTAPTIANLTVIGNSGGDSSDTLAHLAREGYRGNIHRTVYTDDPNNGTKFKTACIDVDEMSGSSWLDDSPLTYEDVVFNCDNGALADADD